MKSRALMTALFVLLTSVSGLARSIDIQPYSQEALTRTQAVGGPVALHFHADWCSTCKAQEKSFKALKDDPQLQGITLLVVDYDAERELKRTLKVRSQSVIIVFRGNQETTRVGGETRTDKLKAALLTAR
jgi:thiol:disulfide interchange protein